MSSLFVKSGVVLAICTALTACGGSDDNSSAIKSGEKSTTTIKVIDGYLENAEVCIDKNDNKICEAGEVVGTTNKNGEIAIATNQLTHPLIAKVIAGKTQDSDSVGVALKSYTMIADSDQKAITPFTTYANATGQDLSAVAAELGLNASNITGDYVAAKDFLAPDTIRAITYARTLATSLNETIPNTDSTSAETEKFNKVVSIVKTRIADLSTTDSEVELKNLNSTRISIDIPSNGDVSKATIHTEKLTNDLESLLASKPWTMASLSKYWLKDEGFAKINLDKLKHQITYQSDIDKLGHQKPAITTPYTINSNKLSMRNEKDTVIFSSPNLMLSIADKQGDLSFWSTFDPDKMEKHDMTVAMFAGKTWSLIFDESETPTPRPLYAALKFDTLPHGQEKGNITLTYSDGTQETTTWSIGKYSHNDTNIYKEKTGDPDVLKIDLKNDDGTPEETLEIIIANNESGILLVYSPDMESFGLLTENEEQAKIIMDKWKLSKKC